MKQLVTGAAGFIGSPLCEHLIRSGHEVIGIDAMTDYYPPEQKWRNLSQLRQEERFQLIRADLLELDLAPCLDGVEHVFHLAGQPGVGSSWGVSFDTYTAANILTTQRLLEAARRSTVKKFVYASSSSVYGDAESFPTSEAACPRPVSPYGMTKLAAEHLGHLYWKSYGVPVVSVRYFTVFGPRQRPDMAFHRFIRSMLDQTTIEIYGDGRQSRDFTFVADAVEGTVRAAQRGVPGEVYNLGGGSSVTIREVLDALADLLGRPSDIIWRDAQKGDVRHTSADTSNARRQLGYVTRVDLMSGLEQEIWWLEEASSRAAGSGSEYDYPISVPVIPTVGFSS